MIDNYKFSMENWMKNEFRERISKSQTKLIRLDPQYHRLWQVHTQAVFCHNTFGNPNLQNTRNFSSQLIDSTIGMRNKEQHSKHFQQLLIKQKVEIRSKRKGLPEKAKSFFIIIKPKNKKKQRKSQRINNIFQ